MKSLTPIILIAVSVLLFFFQIKPQYADVKSLREEGKQYNEALKVADELKVLRGELAEKLASFSPEELQKLERFMPQRLDTVRMILDANGIALANGVALKDIKTTDSAKPAPAAAGSLQGPYNVTAMSFSFSTSYGTAIKFIKELEQSL